MATAAVLEPTDGVGARGLDWGKLFGLSAATVALLPGHEGVMRGHLTITP